MTVSSFSLRCLGARAIRWPSVLYLPFNAFHMPDGSSRFRTT
ncbi:hypothetical protein [Verrucosispora sp. TAA-831]